MGPTQWADRGQTLRSAISGQGDGACIGVARLGSVELANGSFSMWVQLRGSSWVQAREGRFRMRRGDWIALDSDSQPWVQSGRHGLCIGVALGSETLRLLARLTDGGLFAGRGRIGGRDARLALRLWRKAEAKGSGDASSPVPLLLHLIALQGELAANVPRCPGRSRVRKRQVFGRFQRARMYLEGHSDRVIRIGELAQLTSFSNWYFSKTFHALYAESPQAAAARLRIERAAMLLRDTSMMIGEVAAACGFDNSASFARAFRARFGTSASDYRRGMAGRSMPARPPALAMQAAPDRQHSVQPC